MNARALPLLFLLVSAPAAAQGPPDALVPEYELTVADGARLRALFRENAWAKEFAASNLARGTMVRLGPVLYAVGRDGKDGWTGRLIDFALDRFLDKRPVKISYFHVNGLVSPLGMTFPELTPRERDAVRLVIKGLRSGPDVAREVADEEGNAVSVSVTPLALRLQRFAAVETGTCLAVSRDPRVAATLSRSCALDPRLAAATLDVRTDEFFSAWSAVLEKLFGVGPHLRITFDWDRRNARFTPAGAALQLAPKHALGSAPLDPALLAAIPADAPLLATAVLPDPGSLDAASAEEYFRTVREKRAPAAYVPVTLVSLGMRPGDGRAGRGDRGEAMSVLLIPRSGAGDKAVTDLDALFNRHGSYEVHASRACPGVVALSPSKAALERIADACSGRKPSFRQAPPRIAGAFAGGPVSAAAFLNVGGFLRSSLLWGWQREAPPPSKGEEPPPPPKELADAMQLLDRLPMYAFSGRAAGDAVVMTGVEP